MGMGAQGGPGGQGARSSGGPGSPEDAMVAIKVDPGKLPKAEDLKALMFPSTLAVAAARASPAGRTLDRDAKFSHANPSVSFAQEEGG